MSFWRWCATDMASTPATGPHSTGWRTSSPLWRYTETYAGYGEQRDFPFLDRLPPVALRENYQQLLQRWLRDTEHRDAWDAWVSVVEETIDLSKWAKGRPGLSFGFPHLVRLRWSDVLAAFEEAAPKGTTTSEFFARNGDTIDREVEFGKASAHPVGEWELLRDLKVLIQACDAGKRGAHGTSTMEGFVRLYVEHAAEIDMRHLEVRHRAENLGMPSVARVADRVYASYVNQLNEGFSPDTRYDRTCGSTRRAGCNRTSRADTVGSEGSTGCRHR